MRHLAPDEARAVLLGASALGAPLGAGATGVGSLLDRLGVIQLDPIDRIGTNADLVAAARVDGLRRGDVHRHAFGRSFEHFAKERCVLHARFFPHYRGQAVETPWWRHHDRMRRVPASVLDAVRAEILERGPVAAASLTRHGTVEPMDWGGWTSTTSVTALAAEVLWTRCEIVCTGRDARGRRLYAAPDVLGPWATAPATGGFAEEMLVERVRAAGLLARAGGAMWSMLSAARTDGTVERLLEDGRLVEARVGRRAYLMLPHPPPPPDDDGTMRVLGPLDPLLWDRALVRDAFGFDYVWEVYKPGAARAWGYYVCPLLADRRLVGRIEARRVGRALVVERRWGASDDDRLRASLMRISSLNECEEVVTLPRPSPDPAPPSRRAATGKDTSRADCR